MSAYKISYYTVKWGDSLHHIAKKFHLQAHVIQNFNRLDDIYAGLILRIPTDYIYNTHQQVYKNIDRSLKYYLSRHAKKRRYYKFL